MNDPLDVLVGRADSALNVMADASEGLSALRVTRRTAGGLVTVTVDGSGALVSLELAEDLSNLSAGHLAATIVEAAAEAANEALARRAAILEEMQSSLVDT